MPGGGVLEEERSAMNSFDEMYDHMLHEEFAPDRPEAKPERRAGLARYRSAALVAAGGLACATVGALLGGLGGYFTLSPAGAHAVTSSSRDLPLSSAVDSASHAPGVASAAPATPAVGSATNSATGAPAFSEAAGPLVQGLAPITGPTADLPTTAPTTSAPVGSGSGGAGSDGPSQGDNGGGSGSGSGGGPIGQATGILELGLTNIVANLTGALDDLSTLSDNPGGALTGLVPPLEGVVSDVTGTLMDLSSLMPLSGTPLPFGSTGGLGAITGNAGSFPVVSTGSPALGGVDSAATAQDDSGSTPSVSALGPLVGSAAAPAGSTASSVPSLPLSSSGGSAATVPSLPVQSSSGAPSASSTASVPTVGSTSGSTTVNVPLPSAPVSTPPVTIPLGPVTVGVNLSGSDSGATLSLP
jgi:hypothetical protein